MDSEVNLEFGRCRRDSCGGFSNGSTIDAERHIRHGMQLIKVVHSFFFPDHGKGTKEAVCPTGYKCSFDINGNGVPCGKHFKDRKELNKHKVDAKHIKKKKADGDKEGENNEVEAVAE